MPVATTAPCANCTGSLCLCLSLSLSLCVSSSVSLSQSVSFLEIKEIFSLADVHCQVTSVFKSPLYNKAILEPMTVKMQLGDLLTRELVNLWISDTCQMKTV